MTEETKEKKCKCKNVKKFVKCALLLIITASTLVSAYYSYQTNQTLNGIIAGTQGAQATSRESITKKYAKNQTLKKAQDSGKPIVAFFYTDWCGYCKRFAPVFNKVTKQKQFKSNLAVAYINCEDKENSELIKEYKIHGFPTVYMIDTNGNKREVSNDDLFSATAQTDLLEKFLKFAQETK